MRSKWWKASSLALAAFVLAAAPALAAGAVGEKAPSFTLKGIDGKTYSLDDYKGKVVVLEWVNPKCPFSDRHAREKTMSKLARQYGDVVWLGINSTNPEHSNFLKPAKHLEWNQKNAVFYPILYDESGDVGRAYDAKTTPHMYIIGPGGKIAYNGAIDDDPPGRKAQAERANYVGGGLAAQTAGKAPDPASTKPYGCTIKY